MSLLLLTVIFQTVSREVASLSENLSIPTHNQLIFSVKRLLAQTVIHLESPSGDHPAKFQKFGAETITLISRFIGNNLPCHATENLNRPSGAYDRDVRSVQCICYIYFLTQLIFIFVLFLGMLLYVNELQTKEKQKFSGIKN